MFLTANRNRTNFLTDSKNILDATLFKFISLTSLSSEFILEVAQLSNIAPSSFHKLPVQQTLSPVYIYIFFNLMYVLPYKKLRSKD